MNIFYKKILKPFLFKQDPERVHENFIFLGSFLGKFILTKKKIQLFFSYNHKKLHQTLFNINFKNPVGLSAGFDYNINLSKIIGDIGFSFASGGTLTYLSYDGNPKPRLMRLPKSQSILVNKGFKNVGIKKALSKSLFTKYNQAHLGISIGATNSRETCTSETQAEDILKSFKYLSEHPYSNNFAYLELNISCPNVVGSGALSDPDILDTLLSEIRKIYPEKTLFVKFQIQMEWERVKKLLEIMIRHRVDAIIIGNLLKERSVQNFSDPSELQNIKEKQIEGNFSGLPTQKYSNELIGNVYREFGNRITIIGVGGIFSAEDAYEKIKQGASLVQLITGMIFEGPWLVKKINKGLVKLLEKDGFENISDAVGSYYSNK